MEQMKSILEGVNGKGKFIIEKKLKIGQEVNILKEGKEKEEVRKQSQKYFEGWDKWFY